MFVGRIEALLVATVLIGLWLVSGSELLSLFGALRVAPVLVWWLVGASLAARWLYVRRARWRALVAGPGLRWWDWPLVLLGVGLFGLAAAAALWSPPSNYDSLVYHLARQVMWLQQGSLDHFPTSSIRLLAMPPLAELAGLHLMILTGGSDVLANTVQLAAYAGTALAVVAITRELGGGRTAQLVAALVFMTYPMAWLQAANTKNDLVVALWAAVLAWQVLRVIRRRGCGRADAALMGGTLGLLALTKGTAAMFALPLCLLGGAAICGFERRRAVVLGAIIAICALLPNLGHFARNLDTFGYPMGPKSAHIGGSEDYVNARIDWRVVSSNVLRNATLHLATQSEARNQRVEDAVEAAHAWLGVDPQDRDTTWRAQPYRVHFTAGNEDVSGSPLHLLLVLVGPLLFLLVPRLAPRWVLWPYLLVGPVAFLAFCAILRWQPWHARLHLPLFALQAAPLGVLLTRRYVSGLAPIVLAVALGWLAPSLTFKHRPLWGPNNVFETERDVLRFAGRRWWRDDYETAAATVKTLAPRTVGLHLGRNHWHYPIMRRLLDTLEGPVRFVETNRIPITDPDLSLPVPDVIVASRTEAPVLLGPDHVTPFYPVTHKGELTVYAPRDDAVRLGSGGLSRFFGAPKMHHTEAYGTHRVGSGPVVAFNFVSERHTPLALRVRCRGKDLEGRRLSVSLNGRPIGKVRVRPGKRFTDVTLPAAARTGINRVRLTGARGVQFSLLRLEPSFPDDPLVATGAK